MSAWRLAASIQAQGIRHLLELLEDVDPDDMRDWLESQAVALEERARS